MWVWYRIYEIWLRVQLLQTRNSQDVYLKFLEIVVEVCIFFLFEMRKREILIWFDLTNLGWFVLFQSLSILVGHGIKPKHTNKNLTTTTRTNLILWDKKSPIVFNFLQLLTFLHVPLIFNNFPSYPTRFSFSCF